MCWQRRTRSRHTANKQSNKSCYNFFFSSLSARFYLLKTKSKILCKKVALVEYIEWNEVLFRIIRITHTFNRKKKKCVLTQNYPKNDAKSYSCVRFWFQFFFLYIASPMEIYWGNESMALPQSAFSTHAKIIEFFLLKNRWQWSE